MRSINWNSLLDSGLTIYFHWFIVTAIVFIAKATFMPLGKNRNTPATWKTLMVHLFFAMLIAGVIGWFLAATLGSPTEDYAGYQPSDKQVWSWGAKVFLIVFPAEVLGIVLGYAADKKLTPEQRLKRNEDLDNAPPLDEGW
jgi:cytochrome b561